MKAFDFSRQVFKLLACGLGLWLTTLIFKSASYESFAALAGAAVILWLINLAVKPVLKLLMIPVGCLTLGLGFLLIDVLTVWAAVRLMPGISFTSFWACAAAAVFTAICSSALTK